MTDPTDLRALLQDRRRKQVEAHPVEFPLLLDPELQAELAELDEREVMARLPFAQERAAGDEDDERAGVINLADVDAREAAALAEIEEARRDIQSRGAAATVRLRFRAVNNKTYAALVAKHRQDSTGAEERFSAFLDDLLEHCFLGAFQGDEKVDLGAWSEIAEQMSPGELDALRSLVFANHKRIEESPFSSTPSKRTR